MNCVLGGSEKMNTYFAPLLVLESSANLEGIKGCAFLEVNKKL